MDKIKLHQQNKHNGVYDFDALIKAYPALGKYVKPNRFGNMSVNFFDSEAVLALDKSLLIANYGITYWELPPESLCPPIPGRADYIHYISDLIGVGKKKKGVKCLDIGVGSSCIYPIIGCTQYGWEFVGSDIDLNSIENAQTIIDKNVVLRGKVELRFQRRSNNIFEGIIKPNDFFDVVISNPPFHNSKENAEKASLRKLQNLKKSKVEPLNLNFGGLSNELWCKGGELRFILNMIAESGKYRNNCGWFTSLVSKERNLDTLLLELKTINVAEYRTINMHQGNKISRILAWRY